MRKLFAFFRRFRIFLFFAMLQFTALYFYFTSLNFPRSQYYTTASQVGGSLWSFQNHITRYINLNETNSGLLRQNKALRERLPESFIRLEDRLAKINDTLYEQQYEYIPATVVNSTFDKQNNYITLNVGWNQGLKRGMGVFSDEGIVGIVQSTSEHYSLVKSVLAKNVNADVMIEKSGAIGLLKWETKNDKTANVSGVSNDIAIKKGSKVLTRGGGGIFPRGLPVGRVLKVSPIEGKSTWNVEIKLAVNFRAIQKVYVIKNLLLKEQQDLEEKIPVEKPQDE
ncbi:MAG: rod shape-determining protein MreC [Bacteroidetes bacterium]|nr:rod shape-determining protein MreC [Bacteroidota bacterium]